MTGKRAPAPPPRLPGFTYVDMLGSGGFADVYLFEQQLPRRRVAVKVLLPDRMAGGAAEHFAGEANVMALLSTHPAIVTIYQAGVSDDGRPYLVMEYCPRANLQVRSRAAAFSVAEALRVGVQVAAAAETAHRAGILHRDIKPANILVTEYNRPALTDFGIATSAEAAEASAGMSIPWSPPEAFSDDPDSGVATDVYALGATVFTLLAGRSPFEVPGGRNGGADLIARIENQTPPRLERTDAPESLQIVLQRAMAKRPGERYESAVAFARALQRVQIELAHSVTPIDILDDSPSADEEPADEDGELTRVRGIVSIEPQTAPAAGQTRRRPGDEAPATAAPATEPAPRDAAATVITIPDESEAALGETVRRAPVSASGISTTAVPSADRTPLDAPAALRRRSRTPLWAGIGIAGGLAVVSGIVVGASLLQPEAPDPATSASAPAQPQDPTDGFVPPPADLTGTVDGGTAAFTWTNPDPQDGDAFVWYPYTLEGGDGQAQSVNGTSVTLPADPSGRTCIAVQLVRAGGTSGDETRGCAP